MKDILVVAEHRRGSVRDVTYELISKGRQLADETGSELTIVVLGQDTSEIVESVATRGPDRVLVVQDPALLEYTFDGYSTVLRALMKERNPRLTLLGHTAYGTDLAPRLAASLDLPFVSDCIDLDFEGERLVATRQLYQGKVSAEVEVDNSGGSIVTVRPTEFPPASTTEQKAPIESIEMVIDAGSFRTETVGFEELEAAGVDIAQADILVAVGRGMGEKENLSIAEELAEVLGGVLAASRPVTDQEWLPRDRQVGQTGKTVKPKLYVALGISGATQHVMGMKSSDLIIAVNKDPEAPIFDYAHYGVVSDLFDVVPLWTEKLEERKN